MASLLCARGTIAFFPMNHNREDQSASCDAKLLIRSPKLNFSYSIQNRCSTGRAAFHRFAFTDGYPANVRLSCRQLGHQSRLRMSGVLHLQKTGNLYLRSRILRLLPNRQVSGSQTSFQKSKKDSISRVNSATPTDGNSFPRRCGNRTFLQLNCSFAQI